MRYFFYLVMSMGVMAMCVSCKKGDTGPAGPQGVQGVVGSAGADGSVIYSGTTTPPASVGKAGDFYMDLGTSVLYGPKTSSGWGTGFSLQGATGAAGANGTNGANGATGATGATGKAGTQIYAGKGAPASTVGVVGDFYMDTVAHTLYGPKLTAGWGVGISLQGATGAAGATGTANVQYTPWFQQGAWSSTKPYGVVYLYFDETVPAISQDIIDKGTVLVYAKFDVYLSTIWPYGQVGLLPITIPWEDASHPYTTDLWQGNITAGNIRIQLTNSGNYYTTSTVLNYNYFRVVIIPGGVSVPAGIGYKKLQQTLNVHLPD